MREIANEHRPGEADRAPSTGGTEPAEGPKPSGPPRPPESPKRPEPPETAREPAPGIEHEPEPDGENIVPVKDRPGTL
jgi:hypothetical protein